MTRNVLNFLIDAVSALVMLGMIATGLLIRFVLPPGSGSRRWLWGLGRHDWGDVHFYLAVAVGAVILLHVALHWQWVCVTLLRPFRRTGVPSLARRNLAGAAFLLLLAGVLGGFVWVAGHSVREAEAGPAHVSPAELEGLIRGSMSLAEVADACGLSLDETRIRLGVPASTPATEQLGRLSKKYSFTMPEARRQLSGPATARARSAE